MSDKVKEKLEWLSIIAEDLVPIVSSRHAAAIFDRGKLISVGVCRRKSHPLQARFNANEKAIFLHAEIGAIVSAINKLGSEENLAGLQMYVARVSFSNKRRNKFWSLSKPCEHGCAKAIKHYGLGQVYYTVSDNSYSNYTP